MKTFRKILASPFNFIGLIGWTLAVSFGTIGSLIEHGWVGTTQRLEQTVDFLKAVKEITK